DSGPGQAEANGILRKPSLGVLDPEEPFLLRGSQELAAVIERRSGIVMPGADAAADSQDVQCSLHRASGDSTASPDSIPDGAVDLLLDLGELLPVDLFTRLELHQLAGGNERLIRTPHPTVKRHQVHKQGDSIHVRTRGPDVLILRFLKKSQRLA